MFKTIKDQIWSRFHLLSLHFYLNTLILERKSDRLWGKNLEYIYICTI